MAGTRMDNVGIVLEDLSAAVTFCEELGGPRGGYADRGRVGGARHRVRDQRVEVAMLRSP